MSPLIQRTCYRCGTIVEGELTDKMRREGDLGPLQAEKWPCPTCGEQLNMEVGTLIDTDKPRTLNFKVEGGKVTRLPDDVTGEPEEVL